MKVDSFYSKVKRFIEKTASRLAIYGMDKWVYEHNLRSTDHLCLPDFICIGAQKSGTSWLNRNLNTHPEIYMSKEKELHYFDKKFFKSLSFYSSWFQDGAGKKKGEITPAYSILPKRRIVFMKKIMPNLKIILILRNPIERAWSAVRMRLIGTRRKKKLVTRRFHIRYF